MATPATMPGWDLDVYYPSFQSEEYQRDFDAVRTGIRELADSLESLDLESALTRLNEVGRRFDLLYSYASCHVSVDSRFDAAVAEESKLEAVMAEFRKLRVRLEARVATMDLDREAERSSTVRDHQYWLERAQHLAMRQMSPAEEDLAADLDLTGASAWSRLHGTVTSQLEVNLDGERLTMSEIRNLAMHADRDRRRRAYEAELAGWKTVESTLAACMNGIKGEVNVLCRRRGWGDGGLNQSLFENAIDRSTLDAMMEAAREAFPDFRRYLHAKARLLGVERCEWYDLFAPVEGSREWPYDKGCEFVAAQFDAYSSKMGSFARRTYAERWIDFPVRPGKVDGAFCASTVPGESRILMNYDGSFNNVKTLAHELGHGYHNLCLADRTFLQSELPATLAETASIFCETVVKSAALKHAEGKEALAILEVSLQAPCQTVVDITSRFLFESAVFADRQARELSPTELCERMEEAQRETYGDGLASYHPYMWAAKPHYYSTFSFYNYPYMFGLLFALGLYAQYQQDPESFRGRYDDLLASTGLADAATLGRQFGFDVHSVEFWRASLDVVRRDIDRFEELVASA